MLKDTNIIILIQDIHIAMEEGIIRMVDGTIHLQPITLK